MGKKEFNNMLFHQIILTTVYSCYELFDYHLPSMTAIIIMNIFLYTIPHIAIGAGYEEIIVDAYPYSSKVSVKAIALRVTKQSMLQHDVAPSARYLDIIIKGAEELKLEPFYIANLKSIPRARVPKILEILARKNVFFTGFLFRRKLIPVVRAISKICWFFYYSVPVSAAFVDSPKNVPSNVGNVLVDEIGSGRVAMIPSGSSRRIGEGIMHSVRTLLSNLALAAIILPGTVYSNIKLS